MSTARRLLPSPAVGLANPHVEGVAFALIPQDVLVPMRNLHPDTAVQVKDACRSESNYALETVQTQVERSKATLVGSGFEKLAYSIM
jgi:hypothetical protein